MVITWDREGRSVRYFVDGEAVGQDDAGFERLLAIADTCEGDVVVRVGELPTGGEALTDLLPFSVRLPELTARVGRPLRYELL